MTEFDNLKNSYAFAIQSGLAANIDYQSCKKANDFIHKFCKKYVDNSGYIDKVAMKQELALLKDSLSQKIDAYYQQN